MYRTMLGIFYALSACTLLFTGCSSDGGGSSTPSLPAVNAAPAEATAANGAKAVNVIINGSEAGDISILAVSGDAAVSFDAVDFMRNHAHLAQDAFQAGAVSLNETINESGTCSGGGTVSINGNATETHIDITASFSNCTEGGETLDGAMQLIADSPDGGYTLSYMKALFLTDFTISDGTSMMMYAGSYIETNFTSYDYYSNAASGTTTSSAQWMVSGLTERYDNLTSAFSDDGLNTFTQCMKNGRIYIDNLAYYVDIDTSYDPNCDHPFVTVNDILESGSMRLIGADDNLIDVNVTAGNEITVIDSNGSHEVILLN